MTNDVVIHAEGLGKSYLIGHQTDRERYTALRDVIAHHARHCKRSISDLFGGKPNVEGDAVEEFWALKDVSFEIERGEVVGLIGRNGAGKSTLLKILSRITEPSLGRVEIRGRVSSLLEVGTGFHPELTGRQNIFLNGAILGMTRAEVRRKFDEIVGFAEVEKFLDTPVKRYSSGMYVRLAFAVAAHLEPEILVVDEVLAVGDSEFQKKCIGKMSDVARKGRTVLFVSHNLSAIRSLCGSAILLREGSISFQGAVSSALVQYNYARSSSVYAPPELNLAKGICVARCSIDHTRNGVGCAFLDLQIVATKEVKVAIHIFLKDASAVSVGVATKGGLGMPMIPLTAKQNILKVCLNTARLAKGRYLLTLRIDGPGREQIEIIEDFMTLDHNPSIPSGCSEALQQEWGYGCWHIESEITTAG